MLKKIVSLKQNVEKTSSFDERRVVKDMILRCYNILMRNIEPHAVLRELRSNENAASGRQVKPLAIDYLLLEQTRVPKRDIELLSALISVGADLNETLIPESIVKVKRRLNTLLINMTLIKAIVYGEHDYEIIEGLLELGADPNAVLMSGENIHELAIRERDGRLIEIITKARRRLSP